MKILILSTIFLVLNPIQLKAKVKFSCENLKNKNLQFCHETQGLLKPGHPDWVSLSHKDETFTLSLHTVVNKKLTQIASTEIYGEELLDLRDKNQNKQKVILQDLNGDGKVEVIFTPFFLPNSSRLIVRSFDSKTKNFVPLKTLENETDVPIYTNSATRVSQKGCVKVPQIDINVDTGNKKIYSRTLAFAKECGK